MSVIERGLDGLAGISDQFNDVLRRRFRELAGLSLIALAFTGATALATWSVQDPSLSHATKARVHNMIGLQGAIAADLLMQLLGLASIVLVLLVAILGWRLLTHRPLYRERWRLLFWIAAAVFAAAFASCLPRTASWPLPTGLGGVIGDALLRMPVYFFGPIAGMARLAVAGTAGVLALAAFAVAAGALWRDPDAEEEERPARGRYGDHDDDDAARTSISLGWLVHGFLSLKARLRMFFAERDEPSPARAAVARARLEPRFTDAVDLEEEFDEEEEEEEDAAPRRKRARPARPAPRRSSGGYVLPSLNLLSAPRSSERSTLSNAEIEENGRMLESVLGDFGVRGEIINARPGPVVTLYEL
ncbi:MAG: DNA translocase FtsK 4TM domain-containing protein, partial [Panacagrimonas sp.]